MKIKAKQIILAGAFIVLTLIGYIILPRDEIVLNKKHNYKDVLYSNEISGDLDKDETIYVHIEGAVNHPGIKEVPVKTRLFELIETAGGELAEADLTKVNLASVLKDEQKVYVPYKVDRIKEENSSVLNYNEMNNVVNHDIELININIANIEELQKLDGIGHSMARKIVDYRELNGYFGSIEEIKNVSGIGESKFNKIKSNITI